MTNDQYIEVKRFAEGIKECLHEFRAGENDNLNDNLIDKTFNSAINHALKIINLHLDLAFLKLSKTAVEMEEENYWGLRGGNR